MRIKKFHIHSQQSIPGGKPGGGWLKSKAEGMDGAAPGGGGNWGWGGAPVNPPLWAAAARICEDM